MESSLKQAGARCGGGGGGCCIHRWAEAAGIEPKTSFIALRTLMESSLKQAGARRGGCCIHCWAEAAGIEPKPQKELAEVAKNLKNSQKEPKNNVVRSK
jgi:hypothetical protein